MDAHTALLAVERDKTSMSILLVVDRDTPYTSTLQAFEKDTPYKSTLLGGRKEYILYVRVPGKQSGIGISR